MKQRIICNVRKLFRETAAERASDAKHFISHLHSLALIAAPIPEDAPVTIAASFLYTAPCILSLFLPPENPLCRKISGKFSVIYCSISSMNAVG